VTKSVVRGSARQAVWLIAVGGALTGIVLAGNLFGWLDSGDDALADILTSIVPGVAFIGIGALIVWRTDAARIGWLLGAMGTSVMAAGVAGGLSDMGFIAGEAIGGAFWLSWILAIGLLITWFPTGRVVSPRWVWLQWSYLALIAANFLLYSFSGEVCDVYSDEVGGCVTWVRNPIGIEGVPNPEFGAISGPLFAFAGVLFVSAVVSLIVRVVRSNGVERQQLKWFLLAGSLVVLSLVIESLMDGLSDLPAPFWVDALSTIGLVFLPLSMILAIFRYRLYDIDRIISRTVSYAVVAGMLAAVVAGVAALAGAQFDEPLVVAATTLGVAALFNPLRNRTQRLVDRRFNRAKYDAEQIAERFGSGLRDEVDSTQIVEGWASVVATTLQPTTMGVWVR
jgi:hypothetical protein